MSAAATELQDNYGNTFKVGDSGAGLLLPPFRTISDFRQHIRDIREMEMNPDDVIVVGFPKTGSHWVISTVHMLQRGSAEAYFRHGMLGSFLDMSPIRADTIPPADKPRIFFTHLKLPLLPRQVKEKHVKLVYLQRNPKDTWVSLYNHVVQATMYSSTWDHFFDFMLSTGFWYGSWFDYVLDWERDIEQERAASMPIFVSPFEQLKKDPVGQIEKLGEFLGYRRGRELCQQIAQACEFSTLKAAMLDDEPRAKMVKPSSSSTIDDYTRLFYRKGEVGDWRNWFTVSQNERFDHEYDARMQGSQLRYAFL